MSFIERSLKVIENTANEIREELSFMGKIDHIDQREQQLKNDILMLLVIKSVRLN
jgi:hypothetical protein